ncbi:MAG: hypothetical protein U0176_02785 [Bacteroidia bacterium]
MKNNASDDLISLLNSLTGAERRYFRIHASRWGHDEGPTMQLYDFLTESGKWDEAAIEKRFAGMPILKQLNVARTRLQESILHALRDFDNGRTYQLEFSRRLDEIDVLFRRKLFSACLRVAKAAQRRAQSLELPLQELSVLSMLMRLQRQRGASDHKAMEELHGRHKLIARQISAEMELIEVHDQMLALRNRSGSNPSSVYFEAEALLLTPIMRSDVAALAFDAKVLYWHILSYHAVIRRDYGAYHHCHQHLVEVWESLPDRMRLEEERAFKTLANYAESVAIADRLEDMPKAIDKLKRLLGRSTMLKGAEHVRIMSIELEYFIKVGRNDEAADLANKVREKLEPSSTKIPPALRLSLISNALVSCFLVARWTAVLEWAQQLELEIGPPSGEQLHGLALVTHAIALYELHRHEEMERVLKAHAKAVRREESIGISQAISALLTCEDEVQERRVIQALYQNAQTDDANSAPAYLTLAATWAQARLSR